MHLLDKNCQLPALGTVRFLASLVGSYKWGYKFPNMGYKYRFPTYNPTYTYP